MKVNFFKWSDFDGASDYTHMARKANAKLEREGKTVLGDLAGEWREEGTPIYGGPTYQALLISIEQIENIDTKTIDAFTRLRDEMYKLGKDNGWFVEISRGDKPKCTHPKEKVTEFLVPANNMQPIVSKSAFKCECGVSVKPKEFESV